MKPRLAIATLGLLGPLVAGPGPSTGRATQAPSVTLRRWAGEARLVRSMGPGATLFALKADVRWSDRAPGDRNRYVARVTLPDGRVERHPLRPNEGPGSSRLTVDLPASAVRDRLPGTVRFSAVLVDASTGAPLSNALAGTIEQFPTPEVPGAAEARGPFGWGRPLASGPGEAAELPNAGPDGFRFARLPRDPGDGGPVLFVAATEASNEQVAGRLPDHDPNAGRSDEFLLDDPAQPAVNLTPGDARRFVEALGAADPSGIAYRLPTRDEWRRAAGAGRSGRFWWGDGPPLGPFANFLGPESGLEADTTAPASPLGSSFQRNPWGLLHTFGNAAEWATDDELGGAVRLGGHFRTEASEAAGPIAVPDDSSLGPDPFVGVRPVFALDAEGGAAMLEAALRRDGRLGGVSVRFDPLRATATLVGTVDEPGDRRRADDAIRGAWFVSAVVNELETPTIGPGRLARLGAVGDDWERVDVIGVLYRRVPIAARWADRLAVRGSSYWVNVRGPGGSHWAHRLEDEPGSPTIHALVPERWLPGGPSVALSLGGPSPGSGGGAIISDAARIASAPGRP